MKLVEETEKYKYQISKLEKGPAVFDAKVRKLRDDSLAVIHKHIAREKATLEKVNKVEEMNNRLHSTIEMMHNEIEVSKSELEEVLGMKEELKNTFVRNLNDQKEMYELQMKNLEQNMKLKDERIMLLENRLDKFVSKTLE